MRTLLLTAVLLSAPSAMAGKKKVGEGPCKNASECASGTCVAINDDTYCSQTCGSCPGGMVCDDKLFQMAGVKVCLKGTAASPPKIEENEPPPRLPCANDKQCPNGLICAEMQGVRDCTKPCTAEEQCKIPEIMGMKIDFWSCQADQGSKKKPRQACLPKADCLANPASCMSINAGAMTNAMGGMMGMGGSGAAVGGGGAAANNDEAAAPARQASLPEIAAKLEGNRITLADKRVFELKETKLMMPYPEFEVLALEGAMVELYYGDKQAHAEEAPFLYKQVEIDKYLKLVVKESTGAWSVKFMPKKGFKTTLVAAGGEKAAAAAPASAPAAAGGGDCQKTLLAKGHHSMHLESCKGVDQACAVAVLEAGYHPQDLSNCTPGLPFACVKALLDKKHHPMNLSYCANVDPTCAKALLERGEHPMNLSNCQ